MSFSGLSERAFVLVPRSAQFTDALQVVAVAEMPDERFKCRALLRRYSARGFRFSSGFIEASRRFVQESARVRAQREVTGDLIVLRSSGYFSGGLGFARDQFAQLGTERIELMGELLSFRGEIGR